jgi:hypothetical protein
MQDIKIGDEILIRAKVVEIRTLEQGITYKVVVDNKYSYSNDVMVEPKNIVE